MEHEHNHSSHDAHASHGAHATMMQHDHGATSDDGCSSHHAMVFHMGVCQEILFSGWRTSTALSLLGSAAVLFLAGFLYEGLKYWREALHRSSVGMSNSQVNITKSECGSNGVCGKNVVQYTMCSMGHIIQTILHIVQTFCSYTLMLVFMTYNVWLCAALVLGIGLGHFVFGWRKSNIVDANEHCG